MSRLVYRCSIYVWVCIEIAYTYVCMYVCISLKGLLDKLERSADFKRWIIEREGVLNGNERIISSNVYNKLKFLALV